MKTTALIALLLVGPASANGLDDLRAALAPLQGQGALHGIYEARESRTELDAKPAKAPETVSASAQVDEDANGFQIRWDRALLKRAAEESNPAKGVKKNENLTQLIGSSSATRVANALNYAPQLLKFLANGQLKSERADTWQGKPARLIEVQIVPQEEDNDKVKVKVKDNTHLANIWLSADGVPLAANVSHSIKASFMIFLSFEKTSKEEMNFAVVANRLVVLKREEHGKQKAPGTDSEFKNSYTFSPKA
ncbi:MAG: hypothetical protein V4508_25840 [Pseudomonadota bacterium]